MLTNLLIFTDTVSHFQSVLEFSYFQKLSLVLGSSSQVQPTIGLRCMAAAVPFTFNRYGKEIATKEHRKPVLHNVVQFPALQNILQVWQEARAVN